MIEEHMGTYKEVCYIYIPYTMRKMGLVYCIGDELRTKYLGPLLGDILIGLSAIITNYV